MKNLYKLFNPYSSLDMKTVQFVRHYKLEPLFSDWRSMTWRNFKLLTEGIADPDINNDEIEKAIENKILLTDIDQIITGTKIRTVNTANRIIKYLRFSIKVKTNQLFDEIPSIIEKDISDNEFKAMQKDGILRIIKHRVLNDRESLSRLRRIDEFIRNETCKNILVISSSYLIGLLNYFYNGYDTNRRFKINDAKKYEIEGWLTGFIKQID